jgi:hypothetical protein
MFHQTVSASGILRDGREQLHATKEMRAFTNLNILGTHASILKTKVYETMFMSHKTDHATLFSTSESAKFGLAYVS